MSDNDMDKFVEFAVVHQEEVSMLQVKRRTEMAMTQISDVKFTATGLSQLEPFRVPTFSPVQPVGTNELSYTTDLVGFLAEGNLPFTLALWFPNQHLLLHFPASPSGATGFTLSNGPPLPPVCPSSPTFSSIPGPRISFRVFVGVFYETKGPRRTPCTQKNECLLSTRWLMECSGEGEIW